METAEQAIQIFTTFEKREDADRVLRRLVEARLAACAQVIGPIQSTYHWQGKIETAEEWLGLIKTRRGLYEAVEKAIKEQHPYTVPEILAVPVVAGNADYLKWMGEELHNEGSSAGGGLPH